MKNLKFEILVDGTPRVAYVRPENKSKFLEKYQNNSPREVINAEELDYEIKFEKVNGLGKPQGTNLSQNNQQQNTELPSVDTFSESQEVVNLENVFKSTTKFGYKPFDNETFDYNEQYGIDEETDLTQEDSDNTGLSEEEKEKINLQIKDLEQNKEKYENYFNKYNKAQNGFVMKPQDFFNSLDYDIRFEGTKDQFFMLNGLEEKRWVKKNAEKLGGKEQAQSKWNELTFLITTLREGLDYEQDTQKIINYNPSMYFDLKIRDLEREIETVGLNEVTLKESKDNIINLPKVEIDGETVDFTYDVANEVNEENISNAFEEYLTNNVNTEHDKLLQELQKQTETFFDQSKVLKNFKSRTIKRVNAEFKKESRKLEKLLEEKLSPFRDKIIQELKEKYPNGHCDPEGKGFNLYDKDCYTDKELDEATKKLVEEEKRLIPLIPGYEELLQRKTDRQNELLEKNPAYKKLKLDQVKKHDKFIADKFKEFFSDSSNYAPEHWTENDLLAIRQDILDKKLEPNDKINYLQARLEAYLNTNEALTEEDKPDATLEYWSYMYDFFGEYTYTEEVTFESGLDRFGGIFYDTKEVIKKGASQFFNEVTAQGMLNLADEALQRNENSITINFFELGEEAQEQLNLSAISSRRLLNSATFDEETKTINANGELHWDGKRWVWRLKGQKYLQAKTYEIKEYTPELERIRDLIFDEMEDNKVLTKEQIEILENGGEVVIDNIKSIRNLNLAGNRKIIKKANKVVISKETIDSNVARIYKEENEKLYQQSRKYALDVLENPEVLDDLGFGAGLTSRNLPEYLPFISGLIDMRKSKTIKHLTDKIALKGKQSLTGGEKLILMAYSLKGQSDDYVQKNATIAYKAGLSTAQSLPFLGEFIIGSPVFNAVKKGLSISLLNKVAKGKNAKILTNQGQLNIGQTAKTKITGKADKFSGITNYRVEYVNSLGKTSYISSKAVNYISTIGALNAQTIFSGGFRISDNYYKNLTEDVLFMLGPEGNDIITAFDEVGMKMGLKPIKESMFEALYKGYGMQFSEIFTEKIVGAQAFKWGSRAKKRIFGPDTILGKMIRDSDFFAKISLANITRKLKLTRFYGRPSELVSQFFKMSSYNSVFGEIFEEFVNIPLQNFIMGEGPILQGIRKYDEHGRDIGWDTDTMGSISLSSLFMSTTMSTGGIVLSGGANRAAQAYYVNHRRFFSEEKAMEYLEKLKKENRLSNDLDIEVVNNFEATNRFRDFIKKEGLNEDIVKNDSYKRIRDARMAAETEIMANIENPETAKEVEAISSKIEELQNVDPKSRNVKEINKLQRQKSNLLKDTYDRLSKDENSIFFKNKKLYNKNLKGVKSILKQISKFTKKGDLELVETSNSIEAEAAYLRERFGLERREDGLIYVIGGPLLENQQVTFTSSKNELENVKVDIESLIEEARTAHGFFIDKKNGKQKLILNEDLAITQAGSNVASHELFHFYLNKLLGDNAKMRMALGSAFMKYVNTIDPNAVRDSGFRQRLASYYDKSYAEQSEEAMALFLDAISTGALKFNEGIFTRIGDMFRHIGNRSGANLKFKNGRDVYNFIKEFRNSVKRGKLSDNLLQAINANLEKKYSITGEIKETAESLSQLQEQAEQPSTDTSGLFSKPVIDAAKKRSKKDIRQENKEIYDEIVELHDVLKQENPNITLKEVLNLPENKNLKQELIKNNLGLAIERATVAARVGKGLNLDEKKKIGFNEFLSGYLAELTALADTWNPAENNNFGIYAGGLLRKRYGQILNKAKSSLDREGGPGTVSTDQQIQGETIETQIADQTSRRIKNFESQPVLEQQLNIKNNRVKLAPRLKFVRNEIDFNEKTNNSISKVVNKTNYQTKGKYYEDVLEDITSQVNEKASTPAGVTPTGKAFGVLDAIAKNEFKVDAKAILAKPYNLPTKDSKNIRERIAFLASTDNYFYEDRGKLQKVRARNAQEALIIAKHNTGNLKIKLSDLQRDEVGGIKGILKSVYTPLQYNQTTKKSTKINKASITALYQDMNLRVPNIKGKALNVDNMTEADLLALHGINPDFTLMPHNRKYDGLLKGFIKQSSVFAFNQSVREIQGQEVSDIAEGRPGSAVISGQLDVMFSKTQGDKVLFEGLFPGLEYKHPETAEDAIKYSFYASKLISYFEEMGMPGLLNRTIISTSSTAKNKFARELIKQRLEVQHPTIKERHKVFYYGKGKKDFVVATNIANALEEAKARTGNVNLKAKDVKEDVRFKKSKHSTQNVRNKLNKGRRYFIEETLKENKRNVQMGIDMWTNIHKFIHDKNNLVDGNVDPDLVMFVINFMRGSQNEGAHPSRLWASFDYIDYNAVNDPKGLYFEHALQNANQYRELTKAAVELKNPKEFFKYLKAVEANYKLIAISGKDNTKIDDGGYKNVMSLDGSWNVFTSSWVERYFNKVVGAIRGGINSRNITNIQTGISIGQELNINNDGSALFSKPVAEIQSKQNLNDAFDNQIKFSKTGETRGLSVFDFDDTLGFTKSGVRATVPNLDGTPKPSRKVIFLAGGAGSGKGNVISKLGLEGMGFKIVNSDISLEWLKKNSGLPADMRDLTKEQRSTLGKLGAESRKIARRKMMKYQGNADGVVIDGTGGSVKSMQKLVDEFKSKGYDVSMLFVDTSLDVALERNRARKERSLLDIIVKRNHESVQNNKSTFKTMFGGRFMEVNTDNLTQKSPMPEDLVLQMDDFVSSYEKRRLDAAEFAEQGSEILEQGGEFDFSEFNDVVDGTPGPLLDKAKQRIDKFGNKDVFVLTARPAASAGPIQQFLKSQGLEIPLENITGLANSTANAKAEWFVQKFAEGYNDMYFADDALQNVEAVRDVLNQLDVKSDVVQAKVKFSKTMNTDFNKMIERKKGIAADKIFSEAEAKKLGKNIGRFSIYIPPSAEDFKGLLYYFLGKGEQGNKDMRFMEEALLKPFAKGIKAWNTYKQNMSNDYLNLKKAMPEVSKSINDKVPGTNFTNDSAIRVYLWDKHGFDIPGISESLKTTLVNHVKNNKDLVKYADALSTITKRKDGYIAPGQNWSVSSIGGDLIRVVNKVGRQEFLSEWIENKDVIFSQENLNKIEAVYGTRFIEALNNILYRMENGGNRIVSKDREVNMMVNWINGAVGSIMFFNTRSALLQTLSAVNFVNFSDNNIFKATAAFANQPQFWKDFVMLFNSDQLKQRRRGLQTDVSASELTKSFKENGNSYEAVLNFLLEKGFLPTQIADSTAIAFGGASFYRNRYNKYIKEGMSAKQANDQAMLDFQEIAEETQQSSREDLVSKQQASILGRLVLAFQNVTMQYGRLTKKALSDLVNRRGDTKTNISKIIYYGAVQNVVFASLQSALAFLMFGGSDDEPLIEEKTRRTLNGALDSFLRGLGIHGALISSLKNTALAWQKESELAQEGKGFGREAKWNIAREAISLSPPIGSKVRKVVNAYSTKEFGRDISGKLKFRLENPKLQAATGVIEGLTNIPLNRLLNKANNLEEAITGQHELWQRAALVAGWNKWDIGIKDEEVEEAKEEVKVEKEEKKKEEKKQKKIEKEKIKEEEKKKEEKRKKDEGIKTLRCSGIRSNGQRCNMRGETKKKKFLCVYHKEFKEGSDTDGDGKKEYRCTATKANGQRCKNRTENENKKCYAHQ